MLSATPVNNRFTDLRNQLALAYEGNSEAWKDKLDTSRSVEEIFRGAQKVFNDWSDRDAAQRTTDQLMRMLDFDFFEILDAVTIATPVGKYSPDWAITFREGTVKHIYFVAETKGSLDTLHFNHITPLEQAKIDCAKAHFAAISSKAVTYDVVDSFERLLEIVS